MAKQGVKTIQPSNEQIEEFKKLSGRAMTHPGKRSFTPKIFEEVSALLEAYRKGGK